MAVPEVYEYICGSCGYAAEVCAGQVNGFIQEVLTISCRDCRELYDVVITHLPQEEDRLPDEQPDLEFEQLWERYCQELRDAEAAGRSPDEVLLREFRIAADARTLIDEIKHELGFRRFPPRCPRSEEHAWVPWVHPGPCPCCGEIMQRGALVCIWTRCERQLTTRASSSGRWSSPILRCPVALAGSHCGVGMLRSACRCRFAAQKRVCVFGDGSGYPTAGRYPF